MLQPPKADNSRLHLETLIQPFILRNNWLPWELFYTENLKKKKSLKKTSSKSICRTSFAQNAETEIGGCCWKIILKQKKAAKPKQQNNEKEEGLNAAWIFNWLQQAMETNRREHTRFSCVFHPSLVRRFVVKAIELQCFILISNMGLMVYDVYGRLVRPSTLLAGSNPVLGTVVTC